MKIYRIDKTRWKIGRHRLEAGLRSLRRWGVAFTVSIGDYEHDELVWHVALGPLYVYLATTMPYQSSPVTYGFSFDADIAYWYWGENDFVNEQSGVRYWMWRDRLLDALVGKTMYFRHRVDYSPTVVIVEMPEGEYRTLMTRERECWLRPRWPFRKVVESMGIEIPGGIPYAGKGENSWDIDDDGLFGCGSTGHNFDTAAAHVRDTVMKYRGKYGNPSQKSREVDKKVD